MTFVSDGVKLFFFQNHLGRDLNGEWGFQQIVGQAGSLDVGGSPEFRIRKDKEDGGGTAFADYVWKSHTYWLRFVTECGELKSDFRYSAESVFDAFPWPQFYVGSATVPVAESGVAPDSRPTKISSAQKSDERGFRRDAENSRRDARAPENEMAKIDAVAAVAREVRRVRDEALRNLKGELRALELTLSHPLARPCGPAAFGSIPFAVSQTAQVPGANPLKDAHAAPDAAVLAAYGFSAKKDLLAQLLALNLEVAANIEKGSPVTSLDVPKNYPDAKKLVTEDCIGSRV